MVMSDGNGDFTKREWAARLICVIGQEVIKMLLLRFSILDTKSLIDDAQMPVLIIRVSFRSI